MEEHAFEDEHVVVGGDGATVDGADVWSRLGRALFPAHVRGDCGVPRDRRGRPSAPRARSARRFGRRDGARSSSATKTARRFVPRGEAVLALLSDGRLAIASARRATEWEETVEDVADEDDELEYAKEASHLHHSVGGGDDDGACVKLEAVVVTPRAGRSSSAGGDKFRVASPGLTRRRRSSPPTARATAPPAC